MRKIEGREKKGLKRDRRDRKLKRDLSFRRVLRKKKKDQRQKEILCLRNQDKSQRSLRGLQDLINQTEKKVRVMIIVKYQAFRNIAVEAR